MVITNILEIFLKVINSYAVCDFFKSLSALFLVLCVVKFTFNFFKL